VFQEEEQERTQEVVLPWSADGGQPYREMVRQQYNFSPLAAGAEVEDYDADLDGVTAPELRIVLDISPGLPGPTPCLTSRQAAALSRHAH
jgi:hypothetical protein